MHSLIAVSASLCPDCPPARDARALVLADAFWLRLLWLGLPFVVTAVAVSLLLRWIDRRSVS
jgi:hypothetical protein